METITTKYHDAHAQSSEFEMETQFSIQHENQSTESLAIVEGYVVIETNE